MLDAANFFFFITLSMPLHLLLKTAGEIFCVIYSVYLTPFYFCVCACVRTFSVSYFLLSAMWSFLFIESIYLIVVYR
jgi:hypothetical protein